MTKIPNILNFVWKLGFVISFYAFINSSLFIPLSLKIAERVPFLMSFICKGTTARYFSFWVIHDNVATSLSVNYKPKLFKFFNNLLWF